MFCKLWYHLHVLEFSTFCNTDFKSFVRARSIAGQRKKQGKESTLAEEDEGIDTDSL